MAGDFIQRSRHGTVFYFRRRVPLDLRGRLGRLHVYVSLRTEELSEAKRRARTLAALTDKLFTELRYMQGGDKDGTQSTDYNVEVDFNPAGQPRLKVTDVKPGEESSIEDLAKRMLGLTDAAARPTSTGTPTVAEAIDAVLSDPNIKPSTKKEYRRAFDYFRERMGADSRLGDLPQERFAQFADMVCAVDAWGPKTKAFYITSAQRLYTYYASRNSAVPKIVAVGLKPIREAPAGHDRDEYTLEELGALFRHVRRYRDTEPAKWWVTVATAFLGTRIEELAQAHIEGDFRLDDAGKINFLQVDQLVRGPAVGDRYPKSVKSKAGWREHYRIELQSLLARVVPPVAARGKTAVAAPATIPPLPYGSYRFDIHDAMRERRCVAVGMRPPALYEILETLSFHREPATGLPLPYSDIRVWWCLVNVRLNELRLDFPAFRPNRRPAKPAGGYSGDDTLLTNDRQLIDLHWLWHSGSSVMPKPKHRAIFDTRRHAETGAEVFDWTLAAHFVGRVGAISTKLEDLKVHEDDQFPLMSLRSDAVKQRQADILKRCAELEGVLRRQAARRNSRLDAVTVPDWIKDYVAFRLAEGSPTEAVSERVRLFGESFGARHLTNRKRDLVKLGFRVRDGRAKV